MQEEQSCQSLQLSNVDYMAYNLPNINGYKCEYIGRYLLYKNTNDIQILRYISKVYSVEVDF